MRHVSHLVPVVLTAALLAAGAAVAGELPTWVPDANAERSTIPQEYRWDLSALCPDVATWDAEAASARDGLTRLAQLRTELGTGQGLARYLELYFELDELINRLTLYANLDRVTHTVDPERIARHQQGLRLTAQLMDEAPHLRAAILGRDASELAAASAEIDGFAAFKPFIDGLRRRASRVLGPEAERVLALAGDNLWAQIDLNELPSSSENAFAALMAEMPLPSITDAGGTQVPLSFANYGRYRADDERRVRRDTVAAMFATLKGYENTLAATLAGQAAFDVFLARSRGYDTALDAYLDKDDLDRGVYTNLVATVRGNAEVLHRYVALRRQAMGVEEVHLYDLYVPLVQGVSRDIPFTEARDMIGSALAPLGPAYLDTLHTAMDPAEGWIDLYPHRNKESGAFSASAYGRHPYIKMNYMNTFDGVSTLAHELGHALHSHLSMTHQSYQTYRYVPFLAEVASTCNEVLLAKKMIADAETEQERAWLLSELAETIRTTIFRQTMFAEFELAVHQRVEAGEPVTAEVLDGIYGELLRAYYGPQYTIDPDDVVEWAYIPHFYWKYYVYNYATGLSSGIAIAERIAAGDTAARDAYLEMLRSGSSRPPLELLRDAGVDLTTPEPIEAAMRLMDETLAELEGLLAGSGEQR